MEYSQGLIRELIMLKYRYLFEGKVFHMEEWASSIPPATVMLGVKPEASWEGLRTRVLEQTNTTDTHRGDRLDRYTQAGVIRQVRKKC